jgi:hypothetical protein
MEPTAPDQPPAPEEEPRNIWDVGDDSKDVLNADFLAEQALDPDDDGYLFGTAMGR